MQATFSTAEKRRQALLRARKELVPFLRAPLFSSAADMGEPTKESKEEMHDRATRVRAQVLLALASLVKHFPTASPQSSRASSMLTASPGLLDADGGDGSNYEALQASAKQMNESLEELWKDRKFWKIPLEQHPHDVSVWTAWCRLVSTLAVHQPDYLAPAADVLASMVYESLKNAPESCQDAAWTAALCFTSACPGVLKDAVVFKKLATDVATQMKSGRVSASMVSGILPLGLQLLKHGPEEWGSGQLQALWLPAMLSGFKKSAGGRGGELCAQALAELLLVLVMHQSTVNASEMQAIAEPLLKELVVHSHSDDFGRGLWKGMLCSSRLLLLFPLHSNCDSQALLLQVTFYSCGVASRFAIAFGSFAERNTSMFVYCESESENIFFVFSALIL